MFLLKSALAGTAIALPALIAPLAAQDHDHAGQAAPTQQTAPAPAPQQRMTCPMMQKMMSGQQGGGQAVLGAKPMAGGMADMPCMQGKPAAVPTPAPVKPEHDHDHPVGQ